MNAKFLQNDQPENKRNITACWIEKDKRSFEPVTHDMGIVWSACGCLYFQDVHILMLYFSFWYSWKYLMLKHEALQLLHFKKCSKS